MIEIKGAYNSWNCSAPHGAGRIMSRKAAFKNLSMDEYREQMKGIFTTSVTKDTLDESPMAYKSIEAIVRHIMPTAEIIRCYRDSFWHYHTGLCLMRKHRSCE